MAEYIAGRGTTALGIVGTILGSIGTAGVLGNGTNWLGTNNARNNAAYYEAECACMGDIKATKELMGKDAEIARLQSEKYTNDTELQLYKYIDGQLKDIRNTVELNKDNANAKFAEQAVYNATVNGTLSTVAGQISGLQTIVGQITKTAVPSSAICNFGCGCSGNI